jgi:hypothetical protein
MLNIVLNKDIYARNIHIKNTELSLILSFFLTIGDFYFIIDEFLF